MLVMLMMLQLLPWRPRTDIPRRTGDTFEPHRVKEVVIRWESGGPCRY